MVPPLNFKDHSRSFDNYTYVYPVVSRRSQGLSLGINLNINNACNWRCVYCQVNGLIRGKPTEIDLIKLESELDTMLDTIINGDFLVNAAPENLRRFNDICLSGNGESTMSKQFLDVVKIIIKLRFKYRLTDVKTLLITNGSEIDKPDVTSALKIMAQHNGEVWFKIDSVTPLGISRVNQVNLTLAHIRKNLELSCSLCPTYIQTCWFKTDGKAPIESEILSYIDFIVGVKDLVSGALMYSTARNPALPEGQNISSVDLVFLSDIAKQLEKHNVCVKYYV